MPPHNRIVPSCRTIDEPLVLSGKLGWFLFATSPKTSVVEIEDPQDDPPAKIMQEILSENENNSIIKSLSSYEFLSRNLPEACFSKANSTIMSFQSLQVFLAERRLL